MIRLSGQKKLNVHKLLRKKKSKILMTCTAYSLFVRMIFEKFKLPEFLSLKKINVKFHLSTESFSVIPSVLNLLFLKEIYPCGYLLARGHPRGGGSLKKKSRIRKFGIYNTRCILLHKIHNTCIHTLIHKQSTCMSEYIKY